MMIDSMPQDIKEKMEETIKAIADLHQLPAIEIELMRVMCKTMYVAGMQRATKFIEMLIDGRISKEALKEMLILADCACASDTGIANPRYTKHSEYECSNEEGSILKA